MPTAKMDREMAQWEAESDARTLANAAVIKSDTKRLNKAKTAAKRIAGDEKKEAQAATGRANQLQKLAKPTTKRVVKQKPRKAPARKVASKRSTPKRSTPRRRK